MVYVTFAKCWLILTIHCFCAIQPTPAPSNPPTPAPTNFPTNNPTPAPTNAPTNEVRRHFCNTYDRHNFCYISLTHSMYLILTFYVSFDSHDDCFLIPQPTPGPSTAQPTNAPTTAQPTNAPTSAAPTPNPTTAAPTNEVRTIIQLVSKPIF